MINIRRILAVAALLLVAASPTNADTPANVYRSGELSNGFDYSIYKSDDSLTVEHDEDVSLYFHIGIGAYQENADQVGMAEKLGRAAGDAFRFSHNEQTEFNLDIHDINDEKLTVALQKMLRIATGEFYAKSHDDVGQAFVKKWYQPQFMHLAVAGQIDVAKVEAQIASLFGSIKSTPIERLPRALLKPEAGLNHVIGHQHERNILRILLALPDDVDPVKINQSSFEYADIGITIRSHIRIQSEADDSFEYFGAYLQRYDGDTYFQVDVSYDAHEAKAIPTTKWVMSELAVIRKAGITQNDLSGLRMWLPAEAIDHFSPFTPDGKPWHIASNLAGYSDNSSPSVGGSSDEQFQEALEFNKNIDHKKLDKLLKRVLSGKMRMVTIGKQEISTKLKMLLGKLIDDYNERRK